MLNLALHPIAIGALLVAFVFVSVMMILIVLIQRPQGGGLSEAFGSNSGSGHTAFGAKTGDALTTATIGIFVLFLLTAVGLNYAVRPPKETINTGAAQPAPSPVPAQSGAPVQTSEPTTLRLGEDGVTQEPQGQQTDTGATTDAPPEGTGTPGEPGDQPGQTDDPQTEEPQNEDPSGTDPGAQ